MDLLQIFRENPPSGFWQGRKLREASADGRTSDGMDWFSDGEKEAAERSKIIIRKGFEIPD